MKQKVEILLEENVLRRARRRAADEGRSLSQVIQDALESYMSKQAVEPGKRDAAYQLFCGRPMELTAAQFKTVLEISEK